MKTRRLRAWLAIYFACVALLSSRDLGAPPLARPVLASLACLDFDNPPPLQFRSSPVHPSVSPALLERVVSEDNEAKGIPLGMTDSWATPSSQVALFSAQGSGKVASLTQGITTTHLRC